jgi:SAM-dependent methyltransferase
MTLSHTPLDAAGVETLDIMSEAPNYNAWQLSAVAPFLGRRICEIGSGLGNISALLLDRTPDLLLLTDTDPFYLQHLRERYAGHASVALEPLSLPDPSAASRLGPHRLDTALAFNVIEHISDDVGALTTMASLVGTGGRVIVLVPALPRLYGSLDRELTHVRRYTRRSLAQAFERANCTAESMFYFNMLGACGWWLNARLLGVPRIPRSQLRWFDRLIPLLRAEDRLPRPFGLSVIGIGAVR